MAASSPLLRARLTAQGLAGPPLAHGTGAPVAVARRLLAIQAQDPRGARLSIRARSRGCEGRDIDTALTVDRSLLVTWLNRGTLHLVTAGDYPLLQALTTPPLRTSVDTRLAQNGLDGRLAERAVGCVDTALAAEGPLSRAALRERLRDAGVPVEGQALAHVLVRAAVDGVLVRGPVDRGEQLYARVADWLPGARDAVTSWRADRPRALAQLAERYLAGHGPAGVRDLARWAGLPLRDARAGMDAIADRVVTRDDGLVDLVGRDVVSRLARPRLLGAFEPVLMGWCSRAGVLGDHEPAIVSGGVFRGFALARGRAVGVWRFDAAGVALQPLERLDAPTAEALRREAAAVTRFLGR